jgi:iron complex transport system substrate-binding protein
MRIVSLLPSATEIVCRLGLADMLVGVSHACDFPPEAVSDLPRVTRSGIPEGMSSAEIDSVVITRLRRGENLFTLDAPALIALAPDLVITQDLCDVGAASFADIFAFSSQLPGDCQIVSLTMPELEDLYSDVMMIAEAAGYPERGQRLNDQLQARLAFVQMTVAGRPRPGVIALEWLDPPFTAGHWTPELIRMAGGHELLGRAGERSFSVNWKQIRTVQPEVILLLLWGYSAEAAERTWRSLEYPEDWRTIPALRNGRVHALDARHISLRPSPRVVDLVEQLARLLHPACFPEQRHD